MITRSFMKEGQTVGIAYPEGRKWDENYFVCAGEVRRFASAAEARREAMRWVAERLASGWIEVVAKSAYGAPAIPDETYDEALALIIASDLPPHPQWQEVYRRLGEHVQNITLRRRLLAAVQRAHKDRAETAERMRRVEELAARLRAEHQDRELGRAATERAMAEALVASSRPVAGERKINFGEE